MMIHVLMDFVNYVDDAHGDDDDDHHVVRVINYVNDYVNVISHVVQTERKKKNILKH